MPASKHYAVDKRLRVDTYQVQKTMYILVADELKKTVTLGLSPLFGSRFAAVKALRKLRREHPTAMLVHKRVHFTSLGMGERTVLLALLIRPGERP